MSAEPFKKQDQGSNKEDLAFVQAGLQKIQSAAAQSEDQRQLAMSRYYFLNQASESAFSAVMRLAVDIGFYATVGFLSGFVVTKIIRGKHAGATKVRAGARRRR